MEIACQIFISLRSAGTSRSYGVGSLVQAHVSALILEHAHAAHAGLRADLGQSAAALQYLK